MAVMFPPERVIRHLLEGQDDAVELRREASATTGSEIQTSGEIAFDGAVVNEREP
jgi:hypothetical protein